MEEKNVLPQAASRLDRAELSGGQADLKADLIDKLNVLSAETLLSDLRRFGNEPSAEQEEALRQVLETYTGIALGGVSGRFAFPLNTGLGKTRSIISWLSAVSSVSRSSREAPATFGLSSRACPDALEVSVIVTASKVEALCEIKRALIDRGVAEHEIGLVHSYKFDPETAGAYLSGDRELPSGYASEPTTEDYETRPFLLLTHQRVKGPEGVSKYNVYRAQGGDTTKRSLIIWDESLLVSETRAFEDDRIESAIGSLAPLREGRSPARDEALDYLRGAVLLIKDEMDKQAKHPARGPQPFRLPLLSGEDIERYQVALGSGEQADLLKGLLDISQEDLRVLANVEQGGGVIWFRVTVPREINNVVILDASHPIRELAQLDPSITTADIGADIVSYENVVIHQLDGPSGRGAMEREFLAKRGANKVTREIAEVIKGIPETEAVLVFTFKPKGKVNFRRVLERDLEREGIDVDAVVKLKVGDEVQIKPRFNFLTWGQETSLNSYAYCSNVILVGILHRSFIDIGSAIIGQRGDLFGQVSSGEIREVVQSEIAHVVYQGLSRGRSRVLQGRLASPMKVWLIHPSTSNLRTLIERVMPGVNWAEWKGKYYLSKRAKCREKTKAFTVAEVLTVYLGGLPPQITEVSTRRMKTDLCMKDVAPRTFTRAMHEAAGATGWVLRGRTVVRAFGHFFGQTEVQPA